jgi:hypothetical protein
MCPKGVEVVCDNSKDLVTISGKKIFIEKNVQIINLI